MVYCRSHLDVCYARYWAWNWNCNEGLPSGTEGGGGTRVPVCIEHTAQGARGLTCRISYLACAL